MKRYHSFGDTDFRVSPQGRWVKFEDVEQLEARVGELEDALMSIQQVSTEPRIKRWAGDALPEPPEDET